MTARPPRNLVRPYGVTARESRACDSHGWTYPCIALTITETVRITGMCRTCDGLGLDPVALEDDGEERPCLDCEEGEVVHGTATEARGTIELDRANTEAVRWLDGTLVDELVDALDRAEARADALAQRLQVALHRLDAAADILQRVASTDVTELTREHAAEWMAEHREENGR
jgi:hypothetical protein